MNPASLLPTTCRVRLLCFFSIVFLFVILCVTILIPFWSSILSGDWVDVTNWDGTMGRECTFSGLDGTNMPFWSRGFARSCCTSYPKRFGKHHKGFFEAGDLMDPLYFLKYRKHIRNGDILYVAIADLPRFVRVFADLPSDARITLVTGQEDIGAPFEIFHPQRADNKHYQMSELWAWPNTQRIKMRDFLADKRLVRWYVQNYDLIGCNHFTCSDIDPVEHADMANKVVPIPIGLDFHTSGEKNHKLANTASKITASVCNQRHDLKLAVANATPMSQRKLAVYGQFDCNFQGGERELTRGEICRLLRNATMLNGVSPPTTSTTTSKTASAPSVSTTTATTSTNNSSLNHSKNHAIRYIYDERKSRSLYWKQLTQVMFAVAPPGTTHSVHTTH